MTSFVLYMTLYPDIQRRARAEIESVVGRDRFTAWEDAKNLPYVNAVLKEVLRIAPVAVMGTPRCLYSAFS